MSTYILPRIAVLAALAIPLSARADCFSEVVVGEPGFIVIDKCGSPQRQERTEYQPANSVEVIRGQVLQKETPVLPIIVEKWYYDTSQNAATVIHLQDSSVTSKERLTRSE